MSERGLILNAAEVRAVLSGNKTQHRVPVKPQPNVICTRVIDMGEGLGWRGYADGASHDTPELKSPFGAPGDVLYVRETFQFGTDGVGDSIPIWYEDDPGAWLVIRWRSPATMPKWASRIRLKVRRVWVERVQAISEKDARAEGGGIHGGWNVDETEYAVNCAGTFSHSWEAKNGKKYPWGSNPWVWCCEFEQQEVK